MAPVRLSLHTSQKWGCFIVPNLNGSRLVSTVSTNSQSIRHTHRHHSLIALNMSSSPFPAIVDGIKTEPHSRQHRCCPGFNSRLHTVLRQLPYRSSKLLSNFIFSFLLFFNHRSFLSVQVKKMPATPFFLYPPLIGEKSLFGKEQTGIAGEFVEGVCFPPSTWPRQGRTVVTVQRRNVERKR